MSTASGTLALMSEISYPMNALVRLLALSSVLLVSSACMGEAKSARQIPVSVPDADAASLVTASEQAAQLVPNKTPDAVLHQIDTDLHTTTFRFTDRASTQEISVLIPAAGVPPEQWIVEVNSRTPLVGNVSPGLPLQRLRAGPTRVAQAISGHWPGCTIRGLTLYLEDDNLTWVAFCNTPEGVASGSADGATGIFQPSAAPPAPLPVTATPVR
jgi:hypothetical protein